MIDDRFSAASFGAKGLNTKQSLELAYELEAEIQDELHAVITDHLHKILGRLNAMGHNLKLFDPLVPGDISFRDDWEDDSGYHCKLRVAVDTIISTGYSHTESDQTSSDPDIDWLNPDSWPNSSNAI
jgi:hypothetical protein